MKLRLIAVGLRPPAWVTEGFEDYARRMPREMPLELVQVPPAARGAGGGNSRQASPERVRTLEAERLLARLGPRDTVVALDERGAPCRTEDLAGRLDDWRMQGTDVAFLIGGADGLAEACRRRADQVLALSTMTLPHALVRVILAEQLYRAWTVLAGHPYHRGD